MIEGDATDRHIGAIVADLGVIHGQGRWRGPLEQSSLGREIELGAPLGQQQAPVAKAGGWGWQARLLPAAHLAVGRFQILQEHPPGEGVNHEVMNSPQQPPAIRQAEERRPRHRPLHQIKGGLQPRPMLRQCRPNPGPLQRREVDRDQGATLARRINGEAELRPAVVTGLEAVAQGGVLTHNRAQRQGQS